MGLVKPFATAMDIMPTMLELAGVQHPAKGCKGKEMAPYRDRKVYPMTGHSWVGHLSQANGNSNEQGIYGDDFWFGWELHGSASVRKGNWKIVWMSTQRPTGKGKWELFDLEKDPGETNDLATAMPDKCKELMLLFDQ